MEKIKKMTDKINYNIEAQNLKGCNSSCGKKTYTNTVVPVVNGPAISACWSKETKVANGSNWF